MKTVKKSTKILLVSAVIGVIVCTSVVWVFGFIPPSIRPNGTDISPVAALSPEEVASFEDIMQELYEASRLYQAFREFWPGALQRVSRHNRTFLNRVEFYVTIDVNSPIIFCSDRSFYNPFNQQIFVFETSAEAEAFLASIIERNRNMVHRVQPLIENDNDTSVLLYYVQYDSTKYNHWNIYEVRSYVRIGNGVFRLWSEPRAANVWDTGVISGVEARHSEFIEVFCAIIADTFANMQAS